jgi:hypothetical protein
VQLLGSAVALGSIAVLYPDLSAEEAAEIMVPPSQPQPAQRTAVPD